MNPVYRREELTGQQEKSRLDQLTQTFNCDRTLTSQAAGGQIFLV